MTASENTRLSSFLAAQAARPFRLALVGFCSFAFVVVVETFFYYDIGWWWFVPLVLLLNLIMTSIVAVGWAAGYELLPRSWRRLDVSQPKHRTGAGRVLDNALRLAGFIWLLGAVSFALVTVLEVADLP